jgi:hypothetical protein
MPFIREIHNPTQLQFQMHNKDNKTPITLKLNLNQITYMKLV